MEKKSREEIASMIKELLEEKPLSIQELSQKLNSNWSTVKETLDQMKRKNEVKEIISTSKIRVFRLGREYSYFGLPIDKEARKLGYFIFDNIKKMWIEKTGKLPIKTDVCKVSVSVIDNLSFGNEIPTIWYNFGKIPLLLYSPEIDYSLETKNFVPENQEQILEEIKKQVILFSSKRNVFQKMAEQYRQYHNILYEKKERIYALLFFENLNNKQIRQKLQELLAEFYLYCPVKDDAADIINLINDFIILIGKIFLGIEEPNECKQDIYSTFDSIWKALASWLFFDTLTEYPKFSNRDAIKARYFDSFINNKILTANDSLSDLESIYLERMSAPATMKLSNQEKFIRDVLIEITGENGKPFS